MAQTRPGKRWHRPAAPPRIAAGVLERREIEGEIGRTTFRNAENGFSVVRLREASGLELALVGPMPELGAGERVRVKGRMTTHPQYGLQFEVQEITRQLPVTKEGIIAYLSSGLIPGVGPKTAEKLWEHFGIETLEVLRRDPGRLAEVPGIGRRRIQDAHRAARGQERLERLVVALRPYDVPMHVAQKIEKFYGDDAEGVVQQEPFRLWRDVGGIGFLTADRVARAMGIAEDAPQRLDALVLYLLGAARDEGHLCLPEAEILRRGETLHATEQGLRDAIARLAREGHLVREDDLCYLTRAYQLETRAAKAVLERLRRKVQPVPLLASGKLSEEQSKAAQGALSSALYLLTGGPGTGKTTTVRAIARTARARGLRVALAAPTGRAAKRLQEAAGLPAATLHRMLGLRGPDAPMREVEADLLIVDEASMLDIWLFERVLTALPPSARLVLVGDADQLPPVGPGEPFADLLRLSFVPRGVLTEIFRQAQESGIVQAAHRIRRGEAPSAAGDFLWLRAEEPQAMRDEALRHAVQVLPKMGIAPLDIQVLSAGHRHETGVQALNEELQAAFNPPRGQPEVRVGDRLFRLGDRVVQLRNDYQRGALNGEVGILTRLDPKARTATVTFPDPDGDREVPYRAEEMRALQLGYCTTVHKAQGSEYPAVVLVLSPQHWLLLGRNLFYTAVTRARQVMVVVAPGRAVHRALRNEGRGVRFGRLADRIRGGYGGGAK